MSSKYICQAANKAVGVQEKPMKRNYWWNEQSGKKRKTIRNGATNGYSQGSVKTK